MISIKNHLTRAAAVGALGVGIMAGSLAPALAASGASVHVHAALAGARVTATGPNTNITGSPAHWMPTKLSGPSVTGTCSGTNNTFTITNKEATAKTVLYNTGSGKKLLGTLKAKTKYAICGSGSKGAQAKFYIKGSKSVLTVTLK